MAETWPFHYSHPYVTCTQCGSYSCYGNGCGGRHCLQPGCDYIERAAFNRFEPSPPQLPTTSCIRPPPQTCNTVGALIYNEGEYVAPQAVQKVAQCSPAQRGTEFKVSQVRYQTL